MLKSKCLFLLWRHSSRSVLWSRNCPKLVLNRCYTPKNGPELEKPSNKWWRNLKFLKFRRYFYESSKILIPVHVITTMMWFYLFLSICQSDVDIVELMTKFRLQDSLLRYLQNSTMGAYTISLFLLRVSTPLRYVVSIVITMLLLKLWRRYKAGKSKLKNA